MCPLKQTLPSNNLSGTSEQGICKPLGYLSFTVPNTQSKCWSCDLLQIPQNFMFLFPGTSNRKRYLLLLETTLLLSTSLYSCIFQLGTLNEIFLRLQQKQRSISRVCKQKTVESHSTLLEWNQTIWSSIHLTYSYHEKTHLEAGNA